MYHKPGEHKTGKNHPSDSHKTGPGASKHPSEMKHHGSAPENSSKKPPLGSGERFAKLKSELSKHEGVTSPGGLASYIGREKYGSKKFASLSAKGKKGY